MRTTTFSEDLFNYHLKDVYCHFEDVHFAETMILESLPPAADVTGLRRSLEDHLKDTKSRIADLQQALALCGVLPCGACKSSTGQEAVPTGSLCNDHHDVVERNGAPKGQPYAVARYSTLVAWAERLGKTEVAKRLRRALHHDYQAPRFTAGASIPLKWRHISAGLHDKYQSHRRHQ